MSHILLIEDEPWLAELYQQLLRAAGYTAEWCRDGYSAIDAIDRTPPAAIVLDLLLPWANGVQLLHELRSHRDLQTIPVVVCSNALPPDRRVLNSYGVAAALDKSAMRPQQLIETLQNLV